MHAMKTAAPEASSSSSSTLTPAPIVPTAPTTEQDEHNMGNSSPAREVEVEVGLQVRHDDHDKLPHQQAGKASDAKKDSSSAPSKPKPSLVMEDDDPEHLTQESQKKSDPQQAEKEQLASTIVLDASKPKPSLVMDVEVVQATTNATTTASTPTPPALPSSTASASASPNRSEAIQHPPKSPPLIRISKLSISKPAAFTPKSKFSLVELENIRSGKDKLVRVEAACARALNQLTEPPDFVRQIQKGSSTAPSLPVPVTTTTTPSTSMTPSATTTATASDTTTTTKTKTPEKVVDTDTIKSLEKRVAETVVAMADKSKPTVGLPTAAVHSSKPVIEIVAAPHALVAVSEDKVGDIVVSTSNTNTNTNTNTTSKATAVTTTTTAAAWTNPAASPSPSKPKEPVQVQVQVQEALPELPKAALVDPAIIPKDAEDADDDDSKPDPDSATVNATVNASTTPAVVSGTTDDDRVNVNDKLEPKDTESKSESKLPIDPVVFEPFVSVVQPSVTDAKAVDDSKPETTAKPDVVEAASIANTNANTKSPAAPSDDLIFVGVLNSKKKSVQQPMVPVINKPVDIVIDDDDDKPTASKAATEENSEKEPSEKAAALAPMAAKKSAVPTKAVVSLPEPPGAFTKVTSSVLPNDDTNCADSSSTTASESSVIVVAVTTPTVSSTIPDQVAVSTSKGAKTTLARKPESKPHEVVIQAEPKKRVSSFAVAKPAGYTPVRATIPLFLSKRKLPSLGFEEERRDFQKRRRTPKERSSAKSKPPTSTADMEGMQGDVSDLPEADLDSLIDSLPPPESFKVLPSINLPARSQEPERPQETEPTAFLVYKKEDESMIEYWIRKETMRELNAAWAAYRKTTRACILKREQVLSLHRKRRSSEPAYDF